MTTLAMTTERAIINYNEALPTDEAPPPNDGQPTNVGAKNGKL